MTRTTKLELTQALAALGTEVEALRLANSQLTADNEMLRAKLAAPAVQRENRRVGYVSQYQPSPEQLALRAAMAAAKDLAMRSGRSVRVGA